MDKAPANRILNSLKRGFDRGSTENEIEIARKKVRSMLEAENATIDDVVNAILLDRLPEIQATLLEELETTRRVCAQQAQMLRLREAEKALQAAQFAQALSAVKMMPEAEAETVGDVIFDAEEMAAANYAAEISLRRIEAMNSGGDFSLFEDLVIERLGFAAGWQTQFCNATGMPRWTLQGFRQRDFVPPDAFVLAANFVPLEPKPRVTWTDEMYEHLWELVLVAESNDMSILARRMYERFGIEIPVPCLTTAKSRLKRKHAATKAAEAAAEAERAAAAQRANERLSRRAAREAEMEAERQRVREKAERVREARARARAESDAAWEASVMPPQETLYDRWKRGIFA